MGLLDKALGGSETLSKNEGGTLRTGARVPAPTAPRGEVIGDLWYDTALLTLKAWDGTTWVPIGGGASSGLWYYDPTFDAIAPSKTPELFDKTLYFRAANDNCHRIRFASGTQGDMTGLDGIAILGNARSGLFANGCGGTGSAGGEWRLLWDQSDNRVWITHLHVGTSTATFDFESITTEGGNSGISTRSRSDNNVQWVMYPTSDQLRFWRNGSERVWFYEDGSIASTYWDGNSSLKIGRWHANGAYGGVFLRTQIETINAGTYMIMGSQTDNNTFIASRADNGNVFIRCPNNGATVATFGNTNGGISANLNICFAIPNGIAGDTVFRAGGSGQLGINVSSEKHKTAVRTLRTTPEPDAGIDNPVFKLRPVRFKWKKRNYETNEGLINADEINERHPNGVAGLIAEEVRAICPDAVNIWPAQPEWNWQEGDPMPETNQETGEPLVYKPATPEIVTSIDNDRMVAYLVDAVQHLKEEIDSNKDVIKTLKDEIKALKKDK